MRDLGLTYEQAMHGVQSAIRFDMTQRGFPDDGVDVNFMKHLLVGLDMRASDMLGLVELLIKKGVITSEEYLESMRLAANDELARHQEDIRDKYGLPDGTEFR